MRCPRCGFDDEIRWVDHDHPAEEESFTYCGNCDYNICPECENPSDQPTVA